VAAGFRRRRFRCAGRTGRGSRPSTIAELERAITLHRRSESGPAAAGGSNLVPAVCACPRRIRVAPGTLAQGAIVCAVCSREFAAVKPAQK
jgi:hypothetical protein